MAVICNGFRNISKSVTVITDLNQAIPVSFTIREGTNNAFNHLEDILYFIDQGLLVPGDFLVLDNAAIHWANNNWQQLQNLYQQHNIRVLWLPCYSPELQVCEHVISVLKRYFRYHSNITRSFTDNLVAAAMTVDHTMMRNFYIKCTLALESF